MEQEVAEIDAGDRIQEKKGEEDLVDDIESDDETQELYEEEDNEPCETFLASDSDED